MVLSSNQMETIQAEKKMNSKKIVKKWYPQIEDKEKVSQEFFRNAICFYGEKPERVVNFLNTLPAENCERLDRAFTKMRERAQQYCHDKRISKKKEDEIFEQLVHGKLKEN